MGCGNWGSSVSANITREMRARQSSPEAGPQPRGQLPWLGAAQAPDSGLWSQADVVLVPAPTHAWQPLWASPCFCNSDNNRSSVCELPGFPRPCFQSARTGQAGKGAREDSGLPRSRRFVSICRMSKRQLYWCSSQPHSPFLQATLSHTQGQGHWTPAPSPRVPLPLPRPLAPRAPTLHGRSAPQLWAQSPKHLNQMARVLALG